MTPAEIARNAAAVRNIAARLEAWGVDEAYRRAESLLLNAYADGWKPLDKPEPDPTPAGRGSTEQARREALQAAEAAVRAAKEARKKPKETT